MAPSTSGARIGQAEQVGDLGGGDADSAADPDGGQLTAVDGVTVHAEQQGGLGDGHGGPIGQSGGHEPMLAEKDALALAPIRSSRPGRPQ